jgi:hypothetical protein
MEYKDETSKKLCLFVIFILAIPGAAGASYFDQFNLPNSKELLLLLF